MFATSSKRGTAAGGGYRGAADVCGVSMYADAPEGDLTVRGGLRPVVACLPSNRRLRFTASPLLAAPRLPRFTAPPRATPPTLSPCS